MLKITFRTPQLITQHGLNQLCKFAFCNSADAVGFLLRMDFGDGHDFVNVKEVLRIEARRF